MRASTASPRLAVPGRPDAPEAPLTAAAAPVAVGLLGLTISLLFIGRPSIWYDEAATITASTRSLGQLWSMLGNVDAVHAAYYLVIHALFDVVGYSPIALRVPSAIAVGVAAALTVILARLFVRPVPATIAGVVFCLLPRTTWMGTEGRSYAITAALAALLTIVLVRAIRSRSRRWWVLYTALVVVSCLVFVYLALVVVAHGASVLWTASAARVPRSVPRRWFIASATAALALLPFVLVVVAQSGQLHWIDPIDEDTRREVLQTQWFQVSAEFAIAGWALLLFGAVVLLRRQGDLAAVILPALVLPTVMLLIATAVYTPLYTPRYLSMCLPFVAIAIGAGISAMPTDRKSVV